jgi:hypothetical protein
MAVDPVEIGLRALPVGVRREDRALALDLLVLVGAADRRELGRELLADGLHRLFGKHRTRPVAQRDDDEGREGLAEDDRPRPIAGHLDMVEGVEIAAPVGALHALVGVFHVGGHHRAIAAAPGQALGQLEIDMRRIALLELCDKVGRFPADRAALGHVLREEGQALLLRLDLRAADHVAGVQDRIVGVEAQIEHLFRRLRGTDPTRQHRRRANRPCGCQELPSRCFPIAHRCLLVRRPIGAVPLVSPLGAPHRRAMLRWLSGHPSSKPPPIPPSRPVILRSWPGIVGASLDAFAAFDFNFAYDALRSAIRVISRSHAMRRGIRSDQTCSCASSSPCQALSRASIT